MAHHESAKKRIRRNARAAVVNGNRVSRLRTFIKRVELAIGQKDASKAVEAFQLAQPEIHRSVSKGILHRNTAARKLSRLSARIKALSA